MISISLPTIPISANNAYFNHPKGGRTLTNKGKKYIRETTAHIVQNFPHLLTRMQKDKPYFTYFRIYFEDLLNTTWPEKAKTRYKTTDASNRVKLLEDALKSACGIDDAQNLIVTVEKRQGPPLTEIFIWSLEDEKTPLDEFLRLGTV